MTLTEFRRHPERGSHDRETLHAILDASLVAHVGFVRSGHPSVIPTLVVRRGDDVFLHGSPASALIRAGKAGAELCVTATILDGLVLARSAFNHSTNYRSAMVYGVGRPVLDDEKVAVLDALVEKLIPGRLPHLRSMTRKEVMATGVVAVPLAHATTKVRNGPPIDDEDDYGLGIWAGVVPVTASYGEPVPDPRGKPDLGVPDHVRALFT